jgi:hypothetical protein
MKLKYTVTKFDMPEWETGQSYDLDVFDNPEDALAKSQELEDNNQDDNVFFEVVVMEDKS